MISSVNSVNNLFATPAEGARRGIQLAEKAGQNIAEGDLSPDNFVNLMVAEATVKANAAVTHTADRLVGTLLDEVA